MIKSFSAHVWTSWVNAAGRLMVGVRADRGPRDTRYVTNPCASLQVGDHVTIETSEDGWRVRA